VCDGPAIKGGRRTPPIRLSASRGIKTGSFQLAGTGNASMNILNGNPKFHYSTNNLHYPAIMDDNAESHLPDTMKSSDKPYDYVKRSHHDNHQNSTKTQKMDRRQNLDNTGRKKTYRRTFEGMRTFNVIVRQKRLY
jgi:CRISPR/Cas system-associated endonuclease/helicase Cas3